jgi:hypothetical protein
MATAKNGFKCNVYKVAKWFVSGLEAVKDFIKRVYALDISPTEWMKANVSYKFKYGIYKFEYNGEKYVINSK